MRTIVKKNPVSKEEYLANTINSAKHKYPEIRQDSKTVSFALQYAGTPHTLQQNSGFSKEEADRIYARYHNLYKVSTAYAESMKLQASKDGYVSVAFGLRIRTPMLASTIRGNSHTPHEAEAEGRTVGNALSQSYGLLNNRAAIDFMQKVWDSPYCLDIKPVALIHDASYFVVRDDIDVVEWVNTELIKSMQWQDLPEIRHDKVKLGAALDLFYPDWSSSITIPNHTTKSLIRTLCEDFLKKRKEPK